VRSWGSFTDRVASSLSVDVCFMDGTVLVKRQVQIRVEASSANRLGINKTYCRASECCNQNLNQKMLWYIMYGSSRQRMPYMPCRVPVPRAGRPGTMAHLLGPARTVHSRPTHEQSAGPPPGQRPGRGRAAPKAYCLVVHS
jgi:hypothetical protein